MPIQTYFEMFIPVKYSDVQNNVSPIRDVPAMITKSNNGTDKLFTYNVIFPKWINIATRL